MKCIVIYRLDYDKIIWQGKQGKGKVRENKMKSVIILVREINAV